MGLYVSTVIMNIIGQNLMYRPNQISFRALLSLAPPEFLLCPATDNEIKSGSTAAGSKEML